MVAQLVRHNAVTNSKLVATALRAVPGLMALRRLFEVTLAFRLSWAPA